MTTERLCPVEVIMRLRDNGLTKPEAQLGLERILGRYLLEESYPTSHPRIVLIEQALDILEFK